MLSSTIKHELHPLFPSGDWEGFYAYFPGDQQQMRCCFSFVEGIMSGRGSDPIGSYSLKGTYDKLALCCSFTKYYPSHLVSYTGQVDENGIWGFWEMNGGRGGFHLWPIKRSEAKQAMAFQLETEKVSMLMHPLLLT